MPSELWRGRFIIEYDDVDIEQFEMQAARENISLRKAIEVDSMQRAGRAYRHLKMRTVNILGNSHARVTFVTSEQGSNLKEEE